MIDLHCHLLPGVDDGPGTMEEALALARFAVENGITDAVVTPHIHVNRYENSLSSLMPRFLEFKLALENASIPLRVRLGGEVRLGVEIIELLAQKEVPMLGEIGGYDVVLIEMPHSHILPGTENLFRFLLSNKIRPMIAHPERNKDVIRSLDKLAPLVEMGCLLQVTAGSVSGDFGKYAMQRAQEMLERGWVTILATDAHNLRYRPPDLARGRDAAAKIIGVDAAAELVGDTPGSLLAGG